jgi:hypothetical protein
MFCSIATALFLACSGTLFGNALGGHCTAGFGHGDYAPAAAGPFSEFGFGSSAVVTTKWADSASSGPTPGRQKSQSNWTSADAPCMKFDDMRKPVIGDIGVEIDAADPWANGFRRALRFWNTVLVANFHEENNLNACSVRIIDSDLGIVSRTVAARAQITDWANFRGKIAVSRAAAKDMNSAEIYASAVHEIGHMLGLKHNASGRSVMYYLDLSGTEVLDSIDIRELGRRHALREAIGTKNSLPI